MEYEDGKKNLGNLIIWADSKVIANAANKMDRGWTTLNLDVPSNLKNRL